MDNVSPLFVPCQMDNEWTGFVHACTVRGMKVSIPHLAALSIALAVLVLYGIEPAVFCLFGLAMGAVIHFAHACGNTYNGR